MNRTIVHFTCGLFLGVAIVETCAGEWRAAVSAALGLVMIRLVTL